MKLKAPTPLTHALSAIKSITPRKTKEFRMKHLMIPLLLAGSTVALTATEASAVIYCAAGVYRAGCVARPVVAPIVVAPRAAVAVRAPRAVVVAPRRRVY